MTTMTAEQADALWAGIDDQRTRTVALLEDLTAEEWDRPSLCPGWTVRHVAAHLTMQAQSYRDAAGFVARHPSMLRHVGLNSFIRNAALLQAETLSTYEIVGRIRSGIGSRRHNAFVTPLETLTDSLVHGQDIAVPLGRRLVMDPGPSAVAASRCWETRGTWLSSVFRTVPLDGYRLVATDTDWTRGDGPEVVGQVGALLLLLTGRPAGLDRLAGEGANALRTHLVRPE